MPESDLALLIAAAREAGEIAQRHIRDGFEVRQKGKEGPVTDADLAVDAHLHERLLSARPGAGWLSEEREDDPERLAVRDVFIVDPIDGTRAFVDGSPDWAHSLALARDGRVIAGVVFLPQRDLLYAAALGEGATCNGTPLRTGSEPDPARTTVLATRPTLDARHWRSGAAPLFNSAFRSSLAWRLALVAEARFDAMLTLRPAWEWDVAAGTLLVTEAGGIATDAKGGTLLFNAPLPKVPGVLAAGAVHPALLAALA